MKNKINLKSLFIIAIITSLVAIGSCKKDEPCCDATNPECPNYDPCYGKELPSAAFDMYAKIRKRLDYFNYSDSVFIGDMVYVSSELDDAEYEHTWYVGSEVFHTQNPPGRDYSAVARPATITVSHVIKYTPNLNCFPNDDGYDSVAQSFHLIDRWDELNTHGTFRGVLDEQTDSFEVSFLRCYSLTGELEEHFVVNALSRVHGKLMVVNFHNMGDTCSSANAYLQNPRYGVPIELLNSNGLFGEGSTEGEIEVNNQGEIYMRYRSRITASYTLPDTLWHEFNGIKVTK